MCVGKYGEDSTGDYTALAGAAAETAAATAAAAGGAGDDSLLLSMGMSEDYGDAINFGATHVRVGSTIFGNRVTPGAGPPEAPRAVRASVLTDEEVARFVRDGYLLKRGLLDLQLCARAKDRMWDVNQAGTSHSTIL